MGGKVWTCNQGRMSPQVPIDKDIIKASRPTPAAHDFEDEECENQMIKSIKLRSRVWSEQSWETENEGKRREQSWARPRASTR